MAGTVELPLTRGFVAVVDGDDPTEPWQWRWHAHTKRSRTYARRNILTADRQPGIVLLHRYVMGVSDVHYQGIQVDHVNGDALDNRRSNLRLASNAQNGRNRTGLHANNTSGFRGVSWHKGRRKWTATIGIDGRRVHLGLFTSPEEAARAFDRAALDSYGEFAGYLNFPAEILETT